MYLVRRHATKSFYIGLLLCLGSAGHVAAIEVADLGSRPHGEDWPVFLGPRGDSTSLEQGIDLDWTDGLRLVWSQPLEESYGIGSVSRGRYLQFDYSDGKARLHCWHSETGQPIWESSYDSKYDDLYGYNRGPRCSPLIDGDRVYTFGVEGMLRCMSLSDGQLRWQRDTQQEFGVIQNFFGVGSNPVIFEDLVIVMIGGSPEEDQAIPPGQLDRVSSNGTGIVAFDKQTGKEMYRFGFDLASYSSLKLATHGGRAWCFAFLRGGLTAFDPRTGKVDFEFPWRAPDLESVNASVPVVVRDEVLITETYGPGSALLQFRPRGYRVVWKDEPRSRRKSMQAHWNTPIHRDGFLYGSSGRHTHAAELRCINWKTGEIQWSEPGLTRSSLLYVDDHFICLGEFGTLHLIKVNPNRFEEVGRFRPNRRLVDPAASAEAPLLTSPAWAAPILSRGLLYVRGDDRVACFELIRGN